MKISSNSIGPILTLSCVGLCCQNLHAKAQTAIAPKVAQARLEIQELEPWEDFNPDGEKPNDWGIGFTYFKPGDPKAKLFFVCGGSSKEYGIRVNQHLHRVRQISTKEISKGKGKVGLGARTIEIWSDGKLTLILDYKVSHVSPGGFSYSGKATLKLGDQQSVIKIQASVGC